MALRILGMPLTGDMADTGLSSDLASLALPVLAGIMLAGFLNRWFTLKDSQSQVAEIQASAPEPMLPSFYSSGGGQEQEPGLLLDAISAFASIPDLDRLLQILCRNLIQSVQATYCRIYLLSDDNECLVVRAGGAIREVDWDPGLGRSYPLASLPRHADAMARGEPVCLNGDEDIQSLAEPERSIVFGDRVQSAFLMPLVCKNHRLGVAWLGEVRPWTRTPFSDHKVQVCRALAQHGAMAIENIQFFETATRQNERLQLLVDNIGDGIIRVDLQGRIEMFNPAAEKITGYSAAQAVGKPCFRLLQVTSEDGAELGDSPFAPPPDEPGQETTPLVSKLWIIRPDRQKILVDQRMTPSYDANGRRVGSILLLRDISREEELIRLKAEFLSLVSHELRVPLTNIGACAELLEREKLGPAKSKELLQSLNHQCTHLVYLVDHLLEASRLEEGQSKPVLELVPLIPLIEQVVNQYRLQYPDRVLSVARHAALCLAMADPVSLEVVLRNLIQNAINYSPAGSVITVSVVEQGRCFCIRVADQGIGIPPDQLETIFQRFHRLRAGRSKRVTGFGLGLYISRMLVESQGGTIWVESELGQGACFHFTLQKAGGLDEAQDLDH